ncbi:apolipoprotein N-acyltransferase [Undibacterium sp. Jales W-56]|uniref:apolipoprotein N-acyltransferase n=1 Tax=Undibacterium sp. Jales W-56 TaxID=2897325 RepID=UPI0021CF2CF0|nr:apolipoprotein N-acyltransferase [Undibacterium sp. Jales W-56]MCU6434525.1 apolipoprotein N-acyltransferase [Undibacterium sp. Jales W-56]
MRSSILLSLLAGGLNVFSFAPFHIWPLQIISLALIFWMSQSNSFGSARRQFLLGWSYAFGWLFCGVSWLLIAMTRYGGMPWLFAIAALALLVAYLACYAGLVLLLGTQLKQRWQLSDASSLLLLMPALWMLSEYLRGWVFTGFPWLASGYAHASSPLAGFAALLGVYGLGWMNALLAAAVALGIRKKVWRLRLLVALVALVCLGLGLRNVQWTQPSGRPISVSLLQGNVSQDVKFDPDHVSDSLRLYHDMIVNAPADLVATPETALPLLSSQLPPDYLPLLNEFAQSTDSHLVLGLGVHDGADKYTNSMLGFSRQHALRAYRYDKHHLVPFGEFIPFGFRWFVDLMHIPLGDFTGAAVVQAPMQVKDQLVMPNICYEDLFGEEIARQLAQSPHSPTILLNASNIAWYGDSIAIPQHLQISQMRVLETGRPMLRATNTGATAVIDAHAHVIAQAQSLTRQVLRATVQGTSGLTPYVRWGNAAALLIAALALLLAHLSGRQSRSSAG